MSWLKSGDNAATYPLLLGVGMREDADERLLNEVAGFVWRLASQSAGHLTNSVIDQGTAMLMGGPRARVLLQVAVEEGLMSQVTVDGRPAHKLIEDGDFLHIRDRESVKWDQQRDRDRKNPELTNAVRRRDGDACRYCGCVVNFAARKGGRSGTYDHFEPGAAASLDTYVVACRAHNSSMQDGERLPLLPAPAKPYYTAKTLAWLEDNGRRPGTGTYLTEPITHDDTLTEGGHRRDTARPAHTVDTDPERDQDPAAQREPDPAATPRDPAPAAPSATQAPQPTATHGTRPAKHSPAEDSWVLQEGHVGSGSDPGPTQISEGGARTGRDGAGRAGPGRGGAGADPPRGGRRRSRGGRGRRRGGSGGGDQ